MINWKIRFKNPAFLVPFITAVISFIYQILGIFGVMPRVAQNDLIQTVTVVVNILAMGGILVDPTTKGLSDSEMGKSYEEPN